MWTGILNGRIIGPCELTQNLDGANYLHFLQNDRIQQDSCPAHYARAVRDYLNEEYPDRWIVRSGSILWPARSPDLNPVDIFYWGCIKEKVYSKPIQNLSELRQKIDAASEEINARNFARLVKRSFVRRCRACIRARGKQFEHLL
uniref:SFRICE_030562 n=1 Tax=Spodoptera frugiperda TaxID=7108 RepID=A0A2H1WRI6_SPOFR